MDATAVPWSSVWPTTDWLFNAIVDGRPANSGWVRSTPVSTTVTGFPGPGGSTVPAPIGATHHWVGTSESPELKCVAVRMKRSGSTRSASGATRSADRLARRQTGRLRAMRTPPARRSSAAARASWASTSACEWARSSSRSVEVSVADAAEPDHMSAAAKPAMRVTPKPLKQDNIATTCTRPTSASDRIWASAN